jgi:DNA polymerase I-like protein with 3'-5' exonuclease and polymerase domains
MTRRKLFVNFDKAGAEWVVVAYLSGDARMIDVIESGKSPHLVTGALISGCPEDLVLAEHKLIGDINDPYQIEELRATLSPLSNPDYFLPRSMSIRQAGKKSNHALNYDEGYRVFALYNEMEEGDAKKIVDFYKTRAYPGVPLYHEAIRRELKNEHRTLVNCFGRKVVLRGAWDAKLWKMAYSFKPQSTVVDMVNKAMALWYDAPERYMQPLDLRAQVHDSLLGQYVLSGRRDQYVDLARACQDIDRFISPRCTYSGRDFTIKTDVKIGLNWQAMYPVRLHKDPKVMATEIENTWEQVCSALAQAA